MLENRVIVFRVRRRLLMDNNTYFFEKYAQICQKEFVEEVGLERLIQEIEAEKPRLWQKLIWAVGDWMIILGYRLIGDNFKPAEIEFGTTKPRHQKHCLHS
jgi:hypothetical protein